MWQWFEDLFKEAFTSRYGEDALKWKNALNRNKITPTALRFAMDVTESLGKEYPPNLSMFLGWCKQGKLAKAQNMPAKSIEVKPAQKKIWAENMAIVKQTLKAVPSKHPRKARHTADETDAMTMKSLVKLKPFHRNIRDRLKILGLL